MRNTISIFLAVAVLIGISSNAYAAEEVHKIELPAETAKLKPSTLPGYMIAQQKCSICHSADYINLQPPGMDLKQWSAEVGKMQHAYGAPINDKEIKLISAYLATTYGSAKEADLPKDAATATTASSSKLGAKVLLANNACLSCHAVDKKIIGPAYLDVAERYRNNPKAVDTLMTNIRAGGAGKWGDMPMPAFPGLSDEDLKTLAEFVLSQ